jgi:CRISPR-associated exonuclease Cas4
VVIEIKKSSKTDYAAKMQLLYYIYQIDPDNTRNITGELRFPSERKIEKIELNEKNMEELENTIEDIKRIINLNNVQPIKSYHCKNCAYSEFCWS